MEDHLSWVIPLFVIIIGLVISERAFRNKNRQIIAYLPIFYEELNVETKAALDREAIQFFSNPANIDEFTKHKLTFWVSYNDFFEDIFEK